MGGLKGRKNVFVIFAVIVIMLLVLFVWGEQKRRGTARQLEETNKQLEELKSSTGESSEAAANAVLEKVKALIDIPLDPRPTVATINDVEKLREANPFFNVAENGDYLILTGSRAIVYDPDRNIVLDVAPFQIRKETGSPSPTAKPKASPTG